MARCRRCRSRLLLRPAWPRAHASHDTSSAWPQPLWDTPALRAASCRRCRGRGGRPRRMLQHSSMAAARACYNRYRMSRNRAHRSSDAAAKWCCGSIARQRRGSLLRPTPNAKGFLLLVALAPLCTASRSRVSPALRSGQAPAYRGALSAARGAGAGRAERFVPFARCALPRGSTAERAGTAAGVQTELEAHPCGAAAAQEEEGRSAPSCCTSCSCAVSTAWPDHATMRQASGGHGASVFPARLGTNVGAQGQSMHLLLCCHRPCIAHAITRWLCACPPLRWPLARRPVPAAATAAVEQCRPAARLFARRREPCRAVRLAGTFHLLHQAAALPQPRHS